jgi:hypothetical protein
MPVSVYVGCVDHTKPGPNNYYTHGAQTSESKAIVASSGQQKVANAFASALTDVLKDWLKQLPDLVLKLVESLTKDDGAKNQSQLALTIWNLSIANANGGTQGNNQLLTRVVPKALQQVQANPALTFYGQTFDAIMIEVGSSLQQALAAEGVSVIGITDGQFGEGLLGEASIPAASLTPDQIATLDKFFVQGYLQAMTAQIVGGLGPFQDPVKEARALDDLLHGNPVQGPLPPSQGPLTADQLEAEFGNPLSTELTTAQLGEALDGLPNGTTGALAYWDATGEHAVNFMQLDGTTIFIDSQTAQLLTELPANAPYRYLLTA